VTNACDNNNNNNKNNNVESQRLNEFSIHSGKKKEENCMYTSADFALVVGRFLVRRLPGVHRAAGVHRFVSPFAHLFITY